MADTTYHALESEETTSISNGIRLLSEIVVPGSSQLVKGDIGSGIAHLVIGGLGVAALAPVSPLLGGLLAIAVRANSFSNSIKGRNLWNTATATTTPSATPPAAS